MPVIIKLLRCLRSVARLNASRDQTSPSDLAHRVDKANWGLIVGSMFTLIPYIFAWKITITIQLCRTNMILIYWFGVSVSALLVRRNLNTN